MPPFITQSAQFGNRHRGKNSVTINQMDGLTIFSAVILETAIMWIFVSDLDSDFLATI